MINLFVTTMVIQLCNGSVGPILALFIKSMEPESTNIAFLSGMIAAVPGVSALISAPRLGKLGDRIGTARSSDGDADLCGRALLRDVVCHLSASAWRIAISARVC